MDQRFRIGAIVLLVLAAASLLALIPGGLRERPVPPNAGRCEGGDPVEAYWRKKVSGLEYTDAKVRTRRVRPALFQTTQKCVVAHCRGGVWDGLWTSWHANGAKASEGEYRRGRREGTWTQWGAQGQVLDAAAFDGGTGHWTEWYEDGVKSAEGEYLDGEQSGHWRFWSDAGVLLEEGAYAFGERAGEHRWYAPDGGVERTQAFYPTLPLPPAEALTGCGP